MEATVSTLSATLRALADEPRDEHLILSVYVDRSVDNTGQFQSDAALNQEFDRIAAELGPRGDVVSSFQADRAAIARYLDTEAPGEARGIAIFACSARGIWAPIPLMVPVETHVAADPYPHVFQLARLIDDHEPFIVAVAEGQEADIYALAIDSMEHVERTVASEEINRVQVGGWSQARYQRHTAFMIHTHLKDMADTIGKAVERYGARHIIVAGNDAIKGQVRAALPDNLQEMLVDYVPHERVERVEELFERMEPLMTEVEARQEQEILARLEDRLATKGGLAMAGVADVTQALMKGQVDTLLIRADFAGAGGECPSCGLLRAGGRDTCPYDGSELQPIDLREGLALHTLRQAGAIEICGADDALAAHGGVAALLRFRDDVPAGE
jgi:peptide subunit release factor 1 (eRF1)